MLLINIYHDYFIIDNINLYLTNYILIILSAIPQIMNSDDRERNIGNMKSTCILAINATLSHNVSWQIN